MITMPTLDGKYFTGENDLQPEVRDRLLVGGFNDELFPALTRHGWEGQLVACVGLTISADGSAVSAARFMLQGALSPNPVSFKANLLWRAAADVTLSITLPAGQLFSFAGGTLCSDYVDSSAVRFNVAKGQEPVMPGDYGAHKVGNFCLRIVAHLDKSSNGRSGPHIKFTTLIFPDSATATLDSDNGAQSPSWPGFRLLEGAAALFPKPAPSTWGAPVLPLLATHERAANCLAVPDGVTMRFAIAELMRTAALPTVCITKAARAKTIRSMQRVPENLDPRSPTITWPPSARPAPAEGKN